MRLCPTPALTPSVNVLVELGQESVSYIESRNSSRCVKNALFQNRRGRSRPRWAAVAVQVRHSGSLEGRR